MARDGAVPETPEQLDAWIAAHPEAREPLQRGGYGGDFTADDLLPLLHVFVSQAEGPPRSAVASATRTWNRAILSLVLLAILAVLITLAVT